MVLLGAGHRRFAVSPTHRQRMLSARKCPLFGVEVGNTPSCGGAILSNTHSVTRILTREPEDRVDVVDALIHAPVLRFDQLVGTGAGVYALLYQGDLGFYSRLKRPVDTDGSIVESGGFPVYVGSAQRLQARARDHERKLGRSNDLDPDDFRMIQLSTPSVASALYGEALLIETLKPVWCQQRWMGGFGSRRQGRIRTLGQRTSPWSRLHQATKSCREDNEQLSEMVSAHLESTVSMAATCVLTSRPALRIVS